ncbi:MAG: SGNH/GDSL hydrolase family protein [Polyangiaceae bacterium]
MRPRALIPCGIAALVLVGAGAVAAPGAETAEAPPTQRYRVAAIGDSLTDVRVGGGHYLTELARKCPKSRFDAYGVGGQQTLHMRWRFDVDLNQWSKLPARRVDYTHVIVLGGVNDLSAGSVTHPRLGRVKANLAAMYVRGKRRGLRVVAVTLPPWGRLMGGYDKRATATHSLNDWILDRARIGVVDHAVDIHPILSCGDTDELCPRYRRFATDRVHWNHEGHRLVADALHTQVFADCE